MGACKEITTRRANPKRAPSTRETGCGVEKKKQKTLESTAVNLYIYIYIKRSTMSVTGGGVVKREGNESGVGGLGFFRLPHLLSDPSPVKIQSNQTNNYRKKVF